tara:strand:- start:462 stop:677 length:216 start_codon:yes stop_codon:yes gene_type:complete
MIVNKCLYCGSPNLRADRALSGRLVCTSCGTPYGVRKVGSNKIYNFRPFSLNNRFWLFLCILIVAFVVVVF